uniref:microtubule-severing ATPase n=2 Tax=Spongospora subterranea TaxID=70186 RepID=A0A0H5QJX9_9EUKA|eukprot:CRZ01947.1 hypothetical protein [Spongospora subterranea]
MSLKDATVCLEQARDHERRGRYQAALKLYEKGIRLLMDCKSVASDPSSIRAHISDFLERAENCKKRAIAVRLSSDKACASQAIVKGSLSRSSAAKRISRDADLNASNAGPRVQPHTRRKSCGADESLRSVIEDEIIHMRSGISMNDIVGLDQIKRAIYEAVVLPRLQPELFQGLRKPSKAILLFGPPGNGKTMFAKAIASEIESTFFSISSSSLTSKYLGQGEKLVRTLFDVAQERQPSIIFIDEVDSVLSTRGSSSEHEASRRLKTEFLIRFDGVGSNPDDQILIIAATNLPQELDEAVLRRFARRFYIGNPEPAARRYLIISLLEKNRHVHDLSKNDIQEVVKLTDGYSSSDITELCKEASMWPIRELALIKSTKPHVADIPPIKMEHFRRALLAVKRTTSQTSLDGFLTWNRLYGSNLAGIESMGDGSSRE